MVRVLHVINGLGSGGAEKIIMDWYKNIDTNQVQFDFLIRSSECIYAEEIEKMGGHIYFTSPFPRRIIKNYFETRKIFKENKFDVVHVHANALLYMRGIIEAKKNNVPIRIMHSHNTRSRRKIYKLLHIINRHRLKKYANVFFACSTEAGKWMYGKQKFQVINNGIRKKEFEFSAKKRKESRGKINAKNNLVIGHVGRFMPAKNHFFLLEIFNKILEKKDNAKLVLVGEGGKLEYEVKNQVLKKGLTDNVIFWGFTNDVGYVEQAMDVFVFPSIYEGNPIALIEAQFEGLPCVASDSITKESQISENIQYCSLNKTAEEWADEIIELYEKCPNHSNKLSEEAYKYNIKDITNELTKVYIGEK
ncbi:glycosyltransferase family 1 protein [Lachnobacterium bovis]|uniref:glycosyltransferase family 1 protein n=1 Tax=Lachnobacterium bovis TaxID=140626 RepID=UPI0006900E3B|nr:glycosyltransferase family 1 protein [Lachnobacterium bovis]